MGGGGGGGEGGDEQLITKKVDSHMSVGGLSRIQHVLKENKQKHKHTKGWFVVRAIFRNNNNRTLSSPFGDRSSTTKKMQCASTHIQINGLQTNKENINKKQNKNSYKAW